MRQVRLRLLALVLAALAPGVGLAFLTRVEDRRREMVQAHETAQDLADLIALEEARLVDGIRFTLMSVSHSPAVTSTDRTACGSWLKHLLGRIERSDNLNLAVADIDGNVVCSAVPLTHPVNAADRSYFRAAMERGDFSVGSYQEGRILGRPAVNFGYPIVDDRGKVRGVVFAELDLQRLQELEEEVAARLPAHATLTKIDADGKVLARLPDPGKTVGQVAFSASILARIFSAPNGVFLQPGPEGERPHLYAFSNVPSKATGGRMFVVLNLPEAVAFAAVSRGLRWRLLALALGAVLALALTWVVSEPLIAGPAKRVAGAVHRLAAGDFTVRSGCRYEGAIGEIARGFDEMAASLERRETERRAAEQGLRASEERYRSLFENAHDIVFTLDLAGRLTSLNRAGEAILGYSRDAVLGMDVMQFVAVEHRGLTAQLLDRRRVGDPAAKTYEIEMLTREGARVPLEVSSGLVLAEGHPVGVQAIARDVSERKRLQAQLAAAQRIEAVGRLAAGIAHDFNNLLAVIIGCCELMAHDGLTERARRRLSQIQAAGVSAASLTRQLLAFSRRQVLEPKVLDLNAVVRDSARLVERLIGEDVTLRTRLADHLGRVRADPGQMEQVILNLAVNARDAMANGGSLTIETADADLDEAYTAAHPGAVVGRYVMLGMSDTGIGMDAETQARIFEPFFTTKPLGKGTGLGLATVYGVVKQSGGYIWVSSELGRGTTFRIYLPRVDEPAEPVASRQVAAAATGGSETILLVEDDASLREVIRESLQQAGYAVLEAPSAFAALETARLYSGRIELLLTDIVLPGMNGRALADQLANLVPDAKVLYVSGYTEGIAEQGVLEPGIHFLSKPYTYEQLLRKVREVLDEAGNR